MPQHSQPMTAMSFLKWQCAAVGLARRDARFIFHNRHGEAISITVSAMTRHFASLAAYEHSRAARHFTGSRIEQLSEADSSSRRLIVARAMQLLRQASAFTRLELAPSRR